MKTVCVLIVSCPSIDHVTPQHTGSHLPATPLIIMDNPKCFINKFLRSDPPQLNFRPVGQMSI